MTDEQDFQSKREEAREYIRRTWRSETLESRFRQRSHGADVPEEDLREGLTLATKRQYRPPDLSSLEPSEVEVWREQALASATERLTRADFRPWVDGVYPTVQRLTGAVCHDDPRELAEVQAAMDYWCPKAPRPGIPAQRPTRLSMLPVLLRAIWAYFVSLLFWRKYVIVRKDDLERLREIQRWNDDYSDY